MKQIICAVITICLLTSLLPYAVALPRSGDIINEVEINDVEISPVTDENPDEHLYYSIDSDVHFTVSRHYWRDETENTAYFSAFVRENTYRSCFELTPDEGYSFSENTSVFINGSMENVSQVELKSSGILRIWTSFCVAGMGWPGGYLFYEDFEHFDPKWWFMFDVDFDNSCFYQSSAASGAKVYEGEYCLTSKSPDVFEDLGDEVVIEGDWIVSHEFHCTEGAVLSWYACSQSTSIEEAYTVYILPAGYANFGPREQIWDGKAPVSYEKVSVDLSQYAGRDICVVFNHHGKVENKALNLDLLTVTDASYTRINEINIKGADIYPIIGDMASEHMNYSPDADKHYTVTDHYWYDETEGSRTVTKFEQDHEYTSVFVIAPHEHYYIDDTTDIRINGDNELVCVKNADDSITVRTKGVSAMTEMPLIYGDLNDDLFINTADAVEILKIVVNLTEPTERQKKAADVNNNGKITTADATWVLMYAAGLLPKPE